MKICKKCLIKKPLIDYAKDSHYKDNHKSTCKKCTNEKQPLLRNRFSIIKWYNKIKAIKYLGGKCKYCSTDNVKHLTFHHINPDIKETTIWQLLKGSTWERMEKELNKCELLCHNCHNEYHYNLLPNKNNSKLFFLEYVDNKCKECGYDKCNASLTFHHKDKSDKLFNISIKTKMNLKSINDINEEIKTELNKCEVLCANCHFEKDIDNETVNYVIKNYNDIKILKTKKVDRKLVADMYFNQLIKQADIARTLNVSKGTISDIIKYLKENFEN